MWKTIWNEVCGNLRGARRAAALLRTISVSLGCAACSQTLSEYGMKMAQRIVCAECGLYRYVSDDTDIIKTYGKRPLCWPCLQKRKDNEMDVNMDKEPRIEKRLRKYLDYLSDNNPTTRNYDKMVLARAIVEDHSSTFDRIDK